MEAYPKVNWRYFLHHSEGMAFKDLNFNGTVTWQAQMVGRKDGYNAVAKGEGYYFRAMKEYYETASLQEQWPTWMDYYRFLKEQPESTLFDQI